MESSGFNFKKVALIAGFVVLALVIGFFIFRLFFQTTAPITETPTGETPVGTGGLPEAGSGGLTPSDEGSGQLPDAGTPGGQGTGGVNGGAPTEAAADLGVNAFAPTLSAAGNLNYYNQADGKFYQLGADGKPLTLSDRQFVGVDNVIWSETSNKAILEFPDGSKIRYNFDTEDQVTLPKHWEDFAFSPDGDKIVAKSMGVDPNNRWLVVSNDDGSQAKRIEELGDNGADVISSWSPNNQTIALYSESVDFNRKEIFFIGQNGENFKSIVTEGRGFQPQWSPKGDQLLYSVYSATTDYKPTLWLVAAEGDTIGANRRPLNLNTWADKCSFSGSSMYCAVPQRLERGAGLFPATAESTPDVLYRINPSTGEKQVVNLGTSSYSMKNLSVSPDGNYLYFTDILTNRLRRIKVR